MAVSAALGLSAMSSSALAARAPFDRAKECPIYAYNVCYAQGSPYYTSPAQCYEEVYSACMEGEFILAVNAANPGDGRIEPRPASRPPATIRIG